MATAFYVLCFAVLALLARERATRSGHRLSNRLLASFGLGGACASLASGLRGDVAPEVYVLLACVVVSAATDLSCGRIYNSVLGATLALVTCLGAVDGAFAAISGGICGFCLSAALHFASGGRGIGFGDVKLFAVSGVALGTSGVIACFAASFILGAACTLVLLATSRIRRTASVPFAPYIASGAIATVCLRSVFA
jgi:leader peptidase (prepilin peptidase)/N-methyltransferase